METHCRREGAFFPVLIQSLAQQAVATAQGSPGFIVYTVVLAMGSSVRHRWLVQHLLATAPNSPSTPFLQCRWLLQDPTAVSNAQRP